MNTSTNSGVNFVGVQQAGGYTQKRDVGGRVNRSPAAIAFSPMVYGRNADYQAFVEKKDIVLAEREGTLWTTAK